jgi:TusA-related sulfurtransferase
MLHQDLRSYRCPQQFIQFKLGLREALSTKQVITFSVNSDESMDDIERFFKKYAYSYNLDKQQGLLLVEPLRV